MVIPLEYDYVSSFSEGLAKVEKDGIEGYIDTNGRVVLPAEFDEVKIAEDGELVIVKKGESWGFCTVSWS